MRETAVLMHKSRLRDDLYGNSKSTWCGEFLVERE